MSLFARNAERRTANLTQILEAVGRTTRGAGGTPVNPDAALKVAAFWRCVFLLGDLVASFPVDQYRKQGGRRVEVTPAPVVASPSAIVPRDVWIRQLVVSICLRGNSYGIQTQQGPDGWPTKVEVVHPDTMRVLQPDQLAPPSYKFERRDIDRARVMHVSKFNIPGSAVGLSPVSYGAHSLGMALAAGDYERDLLDGGGHPTGILQTDRPLDGSQAKRAKKRFKEGTTDGLAVLGSGWKYDTIQISPQDLMLMESRTLTAADICMLLGVPPEMLGIAPAGSTVTYANREQRAIDFLTFTLQSWLTTVETAWSALVPRGQYVKLNADALLRADAETRTRIIDTKLRNGTLNADEARAIDDMAPLPNDQGQLFVWPPIAPALPLPGGTPNA